MRSLGILLATARRLRLRHLCVTLLAGYALAHAADENAIVGAGSLQCRDWPKQPDRTRLVAISWVQGFISGANALQASNTGDLMLLPPSKDFEAFVDRFCKGNPDLTLYRASTRMLGLLQKNAERRRAK